MKLIDPLAPIAKDIFIFDKRTDQTSVLNVYQAFAETSPVKDAALMMAAVEKNDGRPFYIDSRGPNDLTLLTAATIKQNLVLVQWLLRSQGANPNLKVGTQRSPLAMACSLLNVRMVKILLEAGASVDTMQTYSDWDVVDLTQLEASCLSSTDKDIIQQECQEGQYTRLTSSISYGYLETYRLLDEGAKILKDQCYDDQGEMTDEGFDYCVQFSKLRSCSPLRSVLSACLPQGENDQKNLSVYLANPAEQAKLNIKSEALQIIALLMDYGAPYLKVCAEYPGVQQAAKMRMTQLLLILLAIQKDDTSTLRSLRGLYSSSAAHSPLRLIFSKIPFCQTVRDTEQLYEDVHIDENAEPPNMRYQDTCSVM